MSKMTDQTKSESLLKYTVNKECIEDLVDVIKQLDLSKEIHHLNLIKTRWFYQHVVKLRFKRYAGFDNKIALFEDSNKNIFKISNSTYNYQISKGNEKRSSYPPFFRMNKNLQINAKVAKYYLNHRIWDGRNMIKELDE